MSVLYSQKIKIGSLAWLVTRGTCFESLSAVSLDQSFNLTLDLLQKYTVVSVFDFDFGKCCVSWILRKVS